MSSVNFDMVLLCFFVAHSFVPSILTYLLPSPSLTHSWRLLTLSIICMRNVYILHAFGVWLMMAHAMIGRQQETPKHARTHAQSKSLPHENEIQWIWKLKIGIFNLGGCFTLYSGCTLQSNAKFTFKHSIKLYLHIFHIHFIFPHCHFAI